MKKSLNKWFIGVSVAIAGFFVFIGVWADGRYDVGYKAGQADFQPQVVEVPVDRMVVAYRDWVITIEKPIYIDREVKVPYPVEKIVEKIVYKPTTDFQSLKEFQAFVDSIGAIRMAFGTEDTCYERALFYWRKAYEQGKRVYIQSVIPLEYNQYFTKGYLPIYGEGEIVVSAIIGKQIYWANPATAEVILRGDVK